jgi:hypothetical protein
MNSQTSCRIIVATSMAAVVVIGAVTFALHSHPVTSVAQTPHPPTPVAEIPAAAPAAAAQIPAASAGVAQIPDASAAVAQIPDAPAAVAHNDSVGTKSADTATPSAVEPKLARNRHLAKAVTSTVATNGVDRVKSADEAIWHA